jgi:hypothetical protein
MKSATFLVVCCLFAALSQRWSLPSAGRCDLDGVEILPVHQVKIAETADPTATARQFCGIECAVRYLERSGAAPGDVRITVHDDVSGDSVSAERPFYLRDGTRVRVFRRWDDALVAQEALHAESVPNPFLRWLAR